MMITCLRSTLYSALNTIERFVGKNISLPVINNIFIKTHGQKLILQATNLEVGAEATLPAKVIKEGSITIPPRILSAILQTITDERVVLKEKQGIISIETESTTSEIRGITGDDFPIIPSVEKGTTLSIPNSILHKVLSKILPIISFSDFKPEISGLFIYTEVKELVFVGTDTFRLFEERVKDFITSDQFKIIIPLRALQELVKILNLEENTEFIFNTEQVLIKTGDVRIITRLINGTYPEYRNLIPKEFSTKLNIPRLEFLSGIKLSSVFASKLHDVVLSYKKDTLFLEITNPEIGKHTRTIKITSSGKDGRIGFNHRYLSDAVESIGSEIISLGLNDESRPAVLRDDQYPKFTAVVMPLRI